MGGRSNPFKKMKLKFIERTGSRAGTRPTISLTKRGAITISKPAQRQYGIKAGDRIALLQDEERPNDFYLIVNPYKPREPYKTKGHFDESYPLLRETGQTSLACNYVDAVRVFNDQFDLYDSSVKVQLGEKQDSLFGELITIITAPLVAKKKESK
jgi:bifunctional DNA-binding transcriptional regulator/antitoxin component of YhaV-PrlF toxin-antitoxin module